MDKLLLPLLLALGVLSASSFQSIPSCPHRKTRFLQLQSTTEDAESKSAAAKVPSTLPAPMLDGNKIIPMRVLMPGLQGHHELSAVYAVLTSGYTKTDPETEWSKIKFVGTTQNLLEALRAHLNEEGSDKVSQIRALSGLPESELQEVAVEWKAKAFASGAKLADWMTPQILQRRISALVNEEEGADGAVESPFQKGGTGTVTSTTPDNKLLKLRAETVDKVLETVRPYLIQDGGNVSVQQVNLDSKQIVLKLEGACGSCASSTVTMSMGIEKVLKENFGRDIEIIQLEEEALQELTLETVKEELSRIGPAMKAMGAKLEIIHVDPSGEVKIQFSGSSKVKQGLELALLDIPHCKRVNFISE